MWRPIRAVGAARRRAVGLEAERRGARGLRQVRAGQVGAAAEQLGQRLREGLERELARLPARDGLGLRVRRDRRVERGLRPIGRQLAAHPPDVLGGELGVRRLVERERRLPGALGLCAARLRVPRGVRVLGQHERLVGPDQRLARQLDLVGAERLAVRLRGAGAVRRALADHRLADDQGRPVGRALRVGDRRIDRIGVVAVDLVDHVPVDRPRSDARVSSTNHGATLPSIEMPLSSYSTISLPSFQAPASAQTSWLMPSIRQPSPTKT